jgi:hypothetical protein
VGTFWFPEDLGAYNNDEINEASTAGSDVIILDNIEGTD